MLFSITEALSSKAFRSGLLLSGVERHHRSWMFRLSTAINLWARSFMSSIPKDDFQELVLVRQPTLGEHLVVLVNLDSVWCLESYVSCTPQVYQSVSHIHRVVPGHLKSPEDILDDSLLDVPSFREAVEEALHDVSCVLADIRWDGSACLTKRP